jgi:hypothetical protein
MPRFSLKLNNIFRWKVILFLIFTKIQGALIYYKTVNKIISNNKYHTYANAKIVLNNQNNNSF